MIEYKPLSAEVTQYLRESDEFDIKGEMPSVAIGYDVVRNGVAEGSIFIIKRDYSEHGFYTLDGYNKETEGFGGIGFFMAMRKIIADFDALNTGYPLLILRDTRRKDLTAVFERFGFKRLCEEHKWHIYLRGVNEKSN